MANFCANCASALDPDAKFCPTCSAPVSYAAALASELRSGVQSNVQAFVRSPAMRVPLPIWVGVIQVFWVFLDIGAALLMVGLMYVTQIATGLSGTFGQTQSVEGLTVVTVLWAGYYLVLLSFEAPLVFGFFGQKQWAYGLFFRGMCPLVFLAWVAKMLLLVGALLSGTSARQGQSSPMIAVFFIVVTLLGAGLFILQVVLVYKSQGLSATSPPEPTGSVLGLR